MRAAMIASADHVSEYSEEAGGLDPAGEAEDAVASADGVETEVDGVETEVDGVETEVDGQEVGSLEADAPEEKVDDAREEFQRELRMLPGDWYVVHSYAGYENRVKTNLESRI